MATESYSEILKRKAQEQASGMPTRSKRRKQEAEAKTESEAVAVPEAAEPGASSSSSFKTEHALEEQHSSSLSDAPKVSAADSTCVVWFKSDLRVRDNPALSAATRSGLPVVALFLVNEHEWSGHDMAGVRADFVLRNLACLKQALAEELDIPLVVKVMSEADPTTSSNAVVETARALGASQLHYNHEYEVDEMKRDTRVFRLLTDAGIEPHAYHDQCVMEPGSVRTKEGNVYKVYSMFKKTWITYVVRDRVHARFPAIPTRNPRAVPAAATEYAQLHSKLPDVLAVIDLSPAKAEVARKSFPAGEAEAHRRLVSFLKDKASNYGEARDLPASDGTSSLSPYLSSGVITTKLCVSAALEANHGRIESGNQGITKWISELIWRDFYRHILVEFPRVCKNKPFKLETDRVPWLYDDEALERWKTGRTGYPIVDAGMRQLNHLGWMHNRLRMITAMFLTKDLLLNWRLGERYFMQNLIDGDFANNNGGWQWSASTGVDPQPYFRIFNPLLQSQKCDPDGAYIRKWVPELSKLKGKYIHNPHGELPSDAFAKLGYPAPIVEHKFARDRCLTAFKSALKKI
ncbi:hypothetical protein HKX48_005995 [Thoreauomyces humboldtii]|nr:hypothetical protein HKX48_005995 [Thoreauomyces humboldtii]